MENWYLYIINFLYPRINYMYFLSFFFYEYILQGNCVAHNFSTHESVYFLYFSPYFVIFVLSLTFGLILNEHSFFFFNLCYLTNWTSLVVQMVKNMSLMKENQVQFLGNEDAPEKGMATHSSDHAWRISWTQEPGGLQSMWLQRVRSSWVTDTFTFTFF